MNMDKPNDVACLMINDNLDDKQITSTAISVNPTPNLNPNMQTFEIEPLARARGEENTIRAKIKRVVKHTYTSKAIIALGSIFAAPFFFWYTYLFAAGKLYTTVPIELAILYLIPLYILSFILLAGAGKGLGSGPRVLRFSWMFLIYFIPSTIIVLALGYDLSFSASFNETQTN